MASKVVGKLDTVSLTFKWEIEDFCKVIADSEDVGDCLESPKFTLNSDSSNIQLHLELYPKGIIEDYEDYFSLFVQVSEDIKVTCSFKILNNEGQVIVDRILDYNVLYTFEGWGFNKFVSRDFVTNPANGVLNDDKITIACEITYRDSEIKYGKVTKREVEDRVLPRLEDEFEVLLNDSKFSDVSLVSEGKEVKVHKCILASRSSVFAAMFDAETKEKQKNSYEIVDVRYDVLVEMIRFIYAEKVNNINVLAVELAVAADKYALDGLKKTCGETMIKNLSLDNVIGSLQLADKLRMDQLKKKAIEFIVENASAVGVKPEFDLLSRDVLREVFCCLADNKK